MKKSLRQLVLVGLSATLLAGVTAPVALAQEDTSSDSTEQVEESTDESEETSEESTEETSEETSEESVEETDESTETPAEETSTETTTDTTGEVAETEASLAQQGVEAAVEIFQNEYPDAEIEEIDVELDRQDSDEEATEAEEDVYNITINGFDADDNDFELEIEWVNGEIREQAFNEGMFNSDGTDTTETTETTETMGETDATLDENAPAETVEDTSLMEETSDTTEVVTDDAAEDQERRGLDLEALLTLDEASEIALAEYGEGEITDWNLTVDNPDWYEFWEEGYENPIWTLEVENTTDDERDDEEIRIDAVTGDIINLEDIDTPASTEDSEGTQSASEEETSEESSE